MAAQSVYDTSMPRPSRDMVRGEILPSAWILQPLTVEGKEITRVIYLVQVILPVRLAHLSVTPPPHGSFLFSHSTPFSAQAPRRQSWRLGLLGPQCRESISGEQRAEEGRQSQSPLKLLLPKSSVAFRPSAAESSGDSHGEAGEQPQQSRESKTHSIGSPLPVPHCDLCHQEVKLILRSEEQRPGACKFWDCR